MQQLCQRIRVPVENRELAQLTSREYTAIHASMTLDAQALMLLLERCDAFRKPARFADLLLACECDARAEVAAQDAPYPQRARMTTVLEAAQSVTTQAVATRALSAGVSGKQVGELIYAARVDAVALALR